MVFMYSFGNFELDAVKYFDEFQTGFFWGYWLIIVSVMNIIILNFIIAEVTNSYQCVTQNI